MKGKFLHNRVLAEPIAQAFEAAGATVQRECPVAPGRGPRSIDLLVEWGGYRIACELERRVQSVGNDVAKAQAVKAGLLFIVTPHARMARAARKELRCFLGRIRALRLRVLILPLGTALQRIRNRSLLLSDCCLGQTSIPEVGPARHKSPTP